MVVYREALRRVAVTAELEGLRASARSAATGTAHDAVVALLIRFGELESAVLDARWLECDDDDPLSRALRVAGLQLGGALRHAWAGRPAECRAALQAFERGLQAAVACEGWPREVSTKLPEGFAYYGLYPETYLEAASEFARQNRPRALIVIGARSIGASLSAVVAAEVHATGCPVRLYTVRPRGAPIDRQLRITAAVETAWRCDAHAHFAVVDEGPGQSGSSLACIASRVADLGIARERIALFPSWRAPAERLSNDAARAVWSCHPQYVGSFDALWVQSGRLQRACIPGELLDVSAGRWRALWVGDARRGPPVQPQHERRKFVLIAQRGRERWLLRFAGLGDTGAKRLERAERLAAMGWTAPVHGLAHGFLALSFLEGRVARRGERGLVRAAAEYLAQVRAEFSGGAACLDALAAMIRANVADALGSDWGAALAELPRLEDAARDARAVGVDARMLPHEWLCTSSGARKADALDHHDDHFFPGPTDIAWDLAAGSFELAYSGSERRLLLDHYIACSGDRHVARRLPFHRLAYLAARLGYTRAATGTAPTAEAAGFGRQADRYAALLRREIAANLGAPPV
ncbi:MAG: hypothetical protein AB7V27_19920 [Candidatus Binatia bacterium]